MCMCRHLVLSNMMFRLCRKPQCKRHCHPSPPMVFDGVKFDTEHTLGNNMGKWDPQLTSPPAPDPVRCCLLFRAVAPHLASAAPLQSGDEDSSVIVGCLQLRFSLHSTLRKTFTSWVSKLRGRAVDSSRVAAAVEEQTRSALTPETASTVSRPLEPGHKHACASMKQGTVQIDVIGYAWGGEPLAPDIPA